ncbi:hypothetical protein FRC07_004667 [Ceratobasidium sp. 392]|nr:hypothetical protein FRC07_004667 [Ceratobasidium sp. 392]
MGLETASTSSFGSTSSNNKTPPGPRSRDPKYYFEDGSDVFLIDGVLFKLQGSLLTSHSDKASEFAGFMKKQLSGNNRRGTSDANPVEIRNIKAPQFRNILFALLGTDDAEKSYGKRPADAEYLSLLTDASRVNYHTQETFMRYLDINLLAVYFGMKGLEIWAHSQLELVLQSTSRLANYAWGKDTLLQAVSCANNMPKGTQDIARGMLAFVCLILSSSADPSLATQTHSAANLETCVRLYKDTSLPTALPKLFGCIFTLILSLGYQSTVWKDQLTRDERAALYVAQAHFTRLNRHSELALEWLSSPQTTITSGEVCHMCKQHFNALWSTSFGQIGDLDSVVPLEDVAKIARLPQYRQKFADFVQTTPWNFMGEENALTWRRSEESGNNKAPPSFPKPRDSKYYIKDGNQIFLVDGVLFQLQGSLLESQMSESSYLSTIIKDQASGSHKKGESDDNPIEIPNTKASQFRNLLFVLLGT